MTSEQFAFWLQGFFEMSGPNVMLSSAQVQMIREHLKTVFEKVTPPMKSNEYAVPFLHREPSVWTSPKPFTLETTVVC